nr:MAG TPA: hypothetical protein [Ackermannviridae sp.]
MFKYILSVKIILTSLCEYLTNLNIYKSNGK